MLPAPSSPHRDLPQAAGSPLSLFPHHTSSTLRLSSPAKREGAALRYLTSCIITYVATIPPPQNLPSVPARRNFGASAMALRAVEFPHKLHLPGDMLQHPRSLVDMCSVFARRQYISRGGRDQLERPSEKGNAGSGSRQNRQNRCRWQSCQVFLLRASSSLPYSTSFFVLLCSLSRFTTGKRNRRASIHISFRIN